MKYLLILCAFLFSFTASEPMRVFLIGDSTMADKVSADFPETGWGMPFTSFFNEAVEVQNHAYNGRSTKSFRREGRWAKVFNQIKKGDYVLILRHQPLRPSANRFSRKPNPIRPRNAFKRWNSHFINSHTTSKI
jgi:hypothetical protein